LATFGSAQQTQSSAPAERQSLDDAWWTGPMLAPSASTLPRGHFLIEPYVYDVSLQGRYGHSGERQSAAHSNGFGSLTYIIYGVADKLSVGLIPTGGYTTTSTGQNSSGIGMGDLTLQGQYRLTKYHERSWVPTTSVAVQETLPTGKYDRLGNRPNDGFGSGAYTTTLGLYSQTYFWLPTGRILRTRFNVSESVSSRVKVDDVSVYSTETGFRGHAQPGSSFYVDAAWEYSLTRRWVLALDATYRHSADTLVNGYSLLSPDGRQNPFSTLIHSGSSEAFGLAPAIEYNLNRNLGVLLGTRFIPAGRNTTATITPALAINFVH